MKKFFSVILVFMFLFVTSCKKDNEPKILKIPEKISATDNAAFSSPINSHNLDKYLFRDDVQYVDLRSSYMVLEEGYVAGFEFIPYYNIVASSVEGAKLYQTKRTQDAGGNNISVGQTGSFFAQYEESEQIINSLFSKTKYIFLISQGGSEGAYLINLLIQLGYDGNLLYNVGGVSNSEGIESYRDVKTNKYYVSGHSGFEVSVEYDFTKNLTPIS